MNHVGSFALLLAFGTAIAGAFAAAIALAGNHRLAAVARNALYATCFLSVLATGRLLAALVEHDFSLNYVWQFSSTDMPTYYLVTSLWGGHAGSLLFWLALLSVYSAAVAFFHRRVREGTLMAGVHLTLLLLQGFFLFLLNFVPDSMPFELLPVPVGAELPVEGNGLNPLLQDPVMAIHPPSLYVGFVGLAIPFAFAMGALVSGRMGIEWIRLSRWWTILAWSFLTGGIILGGFWAYRELGWGGYWAWDPVENSSLLPWLAATAFLHSVIVTEKYRMLKVWNVALIYLAFALTIFGTFLTRSGFVSSVHTFAESDAMNVVFLSFLGITFLILVGLVIYRRKELRSENRIHSFLSREFMFLLNNLVFVSLTFIVFTFTIWPTLTQYIAIKAPEFAARHDLVKQSIGSTAYDVWTAPFFLILVLLTGLGTATSWKTTSSERLLRGLAVPGAIGLAVGALAIWLLPRLLLQPLGWTEWKAILSYVLFAFVLAVTIREFVIAIRARRRGHGEGFFEALSNVYTKNHRRYGGYLVHIGVVFIVAGITSQRGFQQESLHSFRKGETFTFAGFDLRYEDYKEFREENMSIRQATVSVARSEAPDQSIGTIRTQHRVYDSHPEQTMTEVGYLTTHHRTSNLYLVLAGVPDRGFTPVKVYFNPLVNLIWAGAVFMVANCFLLLVPWPTIGSALRARRLRKRPENRIEEAVGRRRQSV